MTALNIGQVVPEKRVTPSSECPGCGAAAVRRVDGGGFGSAKVTLCGACGFEFKERT